MPGDDAITISRENYVRGIVVATLISVAAGLWSLGIIPWATREDLRGMKKPMYKLKQRIIVLETKLGVHHPKDKVDSTDQEQHRNNPSHEN